METIDSTNMETLAVFPVEYDEAEIESPSATNMKNCFIKSDGKWIVFAANSKGSDEAVGNVAVEKSSFARLSKELDAVLAGKLYKEKLDALTFENGQDEIIVSATSSLPLNRFVCVERINISNVREIELDDVEFGSLDLPVKAARKLGEEMKRLIVEGKIQS